VNIQALFAGNTIELFSAEALKSVVMLLLPSPGVIECEKEVLKSC
jgi:hypothetical protein